MIQKELGISIFYRDKTRLDEKQTKTYEKDLRLIENFAQARSEIHAHKILGESVVSNGDLVVSPDVVSTVDTVNSIAE